MAQSCVVPSDQRRASSIARQRPFIPIEAASFSNGKMVLGGTCVAARPAVTRDLPRRMALRGSTKEEEMDRDVGHIQVGTSVHGRDGDVGRRDPRTNV